MGKQERNYLQKLYTKDPNRVISEEAKERATRNGNFLQKLSDEGKLSEYLRACRENTEDDKDDIYDLLK